MSSNTRRAARQRKLIYCGLLVGLFITTIVVRGVVALPGDRGNQNARPWSIQAQSDKLELNEMSQGDVELTGAAVRLLLTGSRGFCVCALWMSANEKQKMQEWNELELTVRSITKLQPRFVTPWLFQSWNLAYNVSVEMDRLNDKYFYISRGISLLAEGESIIHNNPDMRYSLASYYQSKFTTSDQKTTLRCLFQLSCIPRDARDYRTLMRGGQVDLVAFRAFCEKNPQLVRRLREAAIKPGKRADGTDLPSIYLAQSPMDVVNFLKENEVLPNRFRDDAPGMFEDRLQQFPVVPPPFYRTAGEELNPNQAIGDGNSSAVRASRVWFRYANEVIPKPNPEPSWPDKNYRDPERIRRLPSRPTLIIFRQGPMRAQSYIAEQLQQDGWLDDSSWIVDDQRDANDRWFREDVRVKPSANSLAEWTLAHQMWYDHGRDNGLNLTPAERLAYRRRAEIYARHRGFNVDADAMPTLRPEELNDKVLADSIKANQILHMYNVNRSQTNYDFFLYQSEFEKDPRAIEARKMFAEAENLWRKRNQVRDAIALYEKVLGTQQAPGLWGQLLLNRNVAAVSEKLADSLAEETLNQQINYLRLVRDLNQKELRQGTLAIFDIARLASPAVSPYYVGMSDLLLQERLLPALQSVEAIWPPGPYDGVDPKGRPWISEAIVERVRINSGINRTAAKPQPQPQSAPTD